MVNPNYVIINFYPNIENEIKILKCFLGEKEKIIFRCWECFLLPDSEIDQEIKDYILERTIIKTYKKLTSTFYHNGEKSYWYTLRNDEELKKELKEGHYDYVCAILENKRDINDYSYILEIEENYLLPKENKICRAMFITAQDRKKFEKNVLPRLKEIDKDIKVKDIFLDKLLV